MTPRAFQIHPADNVATLLDDAPTSAPITLLGAANAFVATSASESTSPLVPTTASESISRGHKIALTDLAPGDAVLKFGVRIGHATQPIARGAWVHLHNLASDLDERSATLDLHTGAPTDTGSVYV